MTSRDGGAAFPIEAPAMLRALMAERDAALAKGFWAGRACGGKAAQIKSALHELGLEEHGE